MINSVLYNFLYPIVYTWITDNTFFMITWRNNCGCNFLYGYYPFTKYLWIFEFDIVVILNVWFCLYIMYIIIIYIYINIYLFIYLFIYYLYVFIYIYIFIYTIYIYIYIHRNKYIYIYIFIYTIYIYIHRNKYIYIYIYTFKEAPKFWLIEW